MIEIAIRGNQGDTTLDPSSSARFVQFCLQCLWLYEEYFYQHRDGMLNQAGWATNVRRLKLQLRAPGFRAAWRTMSEWFEPDFTHFVTGLIKDAELERVTEMAVTWIKLADEEVAKHRLKAASH